jgi:hypothetical protein
LTDEFDFSSQLESSQFKPALLLIDTLLTELRRLDDKMILTEVHLLESRVYRGVGNLPKSKAALTSARTAANSIYCPPQLQASLDLQSGILHAEDKDYKTAYSYFYEAFENLSSQDDPGALGALKYMLLCKVMLNLVSRTHCSLRLVTHELPMSARRRQCSPLDQARNQIRPTPRSREYACHREGSSESKSCRIRESSPGLQGW